jgi:hypothetical protein
MLQILSSFSSGVWTLSEKGVISPSGAVTEIKFAKLNSGILTSSSKLPICLINNELELQYGELSSSFETISRVALGISLDFWGFCYIQEKVLMYYSSNRIHCFSLIKERTTRKIKVNNLSKMSCCLGSCFYAAKEGETSLYEWRVASGDIKLMKSYDTDICHMALYAKGSHLVSATEKFIDIFTISHQAHKCQQLSIANVSALTWSDSELLLYICTDSEFLILHSSSDGSFSSTVLMQNSFFVTEILEIGEDLYLNNKIWCKFVPAENSLVPENIEKIDEINIGLTKAEFKPFGLVYRDLSKAIHVLQWPNARSSQSISQIESRFIDENNLEGLVSGLQRVAEFENSTRNYCLWKILSEILESPLDESEEIPDKMKTRIKDRSFQDSPNNVTPSRKPIKRSISPLTKSRKSITPSRIAKMQSDPKDLIQLAVDTSSLLNSTTNFPKEPIPKLFYMLENAPILKPANSTPADFLTSDKKALVKKLQGSSDETDLLLACIIAGSLGRQELQKAVEFACTKLNSYSGVCLNLALGSRPRAWEILAENECDDDLAYYSRISGKFDHFFPWIIHLYENGCWVACAVQLIAAGFVGLALQILCSAKEERVAYWVAKCFEGNCRNRKELPTEFEGWFYELGQPRFRSRADEDIQNLYTKYKTKK